MDKGSFPQPYKDEFITEAGTPRLVEYLVHSE